MLTRDGEEKRRESPELVPWQLHYEDQTNDHSFVTEWQEIADLRPCHGVQLYFTRKHVAELALFPHTRVPFAETKVTPPSPRPFFSFARLAQALNPESLLVWRYSSFGYELDDGSLFYLHVHPNWDTDILVIPPDKVLSL